MPADDAADAQDAQAVAAPDLGEPTPQHVLYLRIGLAVFAAALVIFGAMALTMAARSAYARQVEAETSLASTTVYAAHALEARLAALMQRVRKTSSSPLDSMGDSLRRLAAAPDPLADMIEKLSGSAPADGTMNVTDQVASLVFPANADAPAGPSIATRLQPDWLDTALDSGRVTDAIAFLAIAADGSIAGHSGSAALLKSLDLGERMPINLLAEASLSPDGVARWRGAKGAPLIVATAQLKPGMTLAAIARLAPSVGSWGARLLPFALLGTVPLGIGIVLLLLLWREARVADELDRQRRSTDFTLNLAVSGTGCGLWDWDVPGGRIFWSGPLLAMTGRPSRGTWLTLSESYQLLLPADVPKLERFRDQIAQGIGSVEAVLRLQSLQGRTIWCEARLRPLQDGRERIVGMFVNVTPTIEARDIAEARARELERALEAATIEGAKQTSPETLDRLRTAVAESEKSRLELAELAQKYAAEKTRVEEANRTKSEFLANMSHELKTPLNAIIGFSEIMQNELYGALGDERYRGYASDIYASGRDLLGVIDDILEMAKIEAGRIELSIEDLDIGGLIGDCVRLIEPRARDAGVAIDNLVTEAPEAVGDRRATKRILMNLLTNAVKFTLRGGRITLQASSEGGFVKIAVADTGIGIAPDDIERVVKPFEQVEQHQSRSHRGTGLGLAISKALSELQGGALKIESAQGVGTTVILTVPREAALQIAG